MKTRSRLRWACLLGGAVLVAPLVAHAQPPPPGAPPAAAPVATANPPPPATAPVAPANPPPPAAAPVAPANPPPPAAAPVAPAVSPLDGAVLPAPAVAATPLPGAAPAYPLTCPKLEIGQHFTLDPVADGVLIGTGAGLSALLTVVLGSGEIQPQLPGPVSNLPGIDRGAVTQTIDPHAGTYSDAMLGAAIGFAVLDTGLSGLRDGRDASLVDGMMYAESISLTQAITDVTKIAVRRPRPIDYVNCASPTSGGCSSTDLELSFFSGHAATVASISATATYLAFVRASYRSPRPWITLVAGLGLTTFVSYERVRSGAHFPTDVIAGSLAGAGIGVLVPHWHRHPQEAPPVLLGYAPATGGGELTLGGRF